MQSPTNGALRTVRLTNTGPLHIVGRTTSTLCGRDWRGCVTNFRPHLTGGFCKSCAEVAWAILGRSACHECQAGLIAVRSR
jgi:hypothetical protein